MRKTWKRALALGCALLMAAIPALGEVKMTAEPAETGVGGVTDVKVEAGEGAVSAVYTLTNGGAAVFQGKEDPHFEVSFRPREEGEYLLEAEVKYADGSTEQGSVRFTVSGSVETAQGPEIIYSQKDGWWKDKAYGKSDLDKAGCAIFTLSHALQRMGWTGEEIDPAALAVTYKNCLVKNGTAVARLVHNASLVYGFTTKSALVKDGPTLREGLKNGDYYSFGIVLGHIALMTGIDEKAGKVRVADSAPGATFERIKKGKIYYRTEEGYTEAKDPGEIPGVRYYPETGEYGGLEYYMDLDYCARRGGRLIRPAWVFYRGENGKIGAVMENLGSGECDISVAGEKMTVPTRDLSWGTAEKPLLAVVGGTKNVKVLNAAGKRIGTAAARSVLPVLGEEEDLLYVMAGEQRGYIRKEEAEITEPLEGEIRHGKISVKGNTSGRATVKLRFGPSEKERVAANWKTGTEVTLIREEGDFWLVEAKGMRLWVHRDYVTAGDET